MRQCAPKTRGFVVSTAVAQLQAIAAAAREPASSDEKREWELLEERDETGGSDEDNGEAEGYVHDTHMHFPYVRPFEVCKPLCVT